MKTSLTVLLIILFGASLFLASCGMLAGTVQAKNDAGALLYFDEAGRETTEATSPSGKPRQPVTEYAEDGGMVSQGATFAKSILPSPWGDIAGGILGAGGMAVAAWARKRNLEARAARKEADAGIEVIKSIEAVPAAKQALKAAIADEANPVDHSPETKAFIAKVTA